MNIAKGIIFRTAELLWDFELTTALKGIFLGHSSTVSSPKEG